MTEKELFAKNAKELILLQTQLKHMERKAATIQKNIAQDERQIKRLEKQFKRLSE